MLTKASARPRSQSRGLAFSDLAILNSAAIAANYLIDKVQFASVHSNNALDLITLCLGAINAFQLFGWFAAIKLLLASGRMRSATPIEIAAASVFAAFMLAGNLLAQRLVFDIAVSLAALYLFWANADDARIRAAAAVFCALAANAIWGPLFFALCAEEFLWADNNITGAALKALRPDILWQSFAIQSPDGHRIVVLDQCSSFHNMTLAVLCWISMTMLSRPYWLTRDIITAIVACGAIFALNAARIFAMALGKSDYIYWHDGQGAIIFNLAMTLTIPAFCFAGIKYAERRK